MPKGQYYRRHRARAPKLSTVCDLKSPEVRFWEKVNKTEDCWEWQGFVDNMGYGRFNEQGNSFTTHRASWEFTNGRITGGLWVLHKCDNRRCVRPEHLFLGTPLENIADMLGKKRHYTGPHPWKSPLVAAQVVEIRKLRGDGTPAKDIATKFGVSTTCIYDVIHRRSWAHVE